MMRSPFSNSAFSQRARVFRALPSPGDEDDLDTSVIHTQAADMSADSDSDGEQQQDDQEEVLDSAEEENDEQHAEDDQDEVEQVWIVCVVWHCLCVCMYMRGRVCVCAAPA